LDEGKPGLSFRNDLHVDSRDHRPAFKRSRPAADAGGVAGAASNQLSPRTSIVLFPQRVPIVLTRGGLVPLGVFALMFLWLSAGSRPSVAAAAVLLGGVGGVISLIVHELGHVSVARRLPGVRPGKVLLTSLGAETHLEGSYRSGREQTRMALGGPEASFALALALFALVLLPAPMWLRWGALALALLNAAIGGLSLLPIHPLDGHKLIVGLVWCAVGSEARARRIVRRVGLACVAVDAAVGALLLVERPLLGCTVAALAGVVFAQKQLVKRPARA
jgi:Zn-dependent protease